MNLDPLNLEKFLSFIEARAEVWRVKNEGGPGPWTQDPWLQRGHFCNVWRELDRGTLAEWEACRGKSFEDRLRFICLYRHSLKLETANRLLLNGYVQFRRSNGSGPFLGPMRLSSRWESMESLLNNHRDDVNRQLKTLVEAVQVAPSAVYLFTKLKRLLPRLGEFRAYEVMTSLTYQPEYRFNEDQDLLIGPGAQASLEKLVGQVNPLDQLLCLVELKPIIKKYLVERGKLCWIPITKQLKTRDKTKFTLRTLEDCLCEWRKYEDVKLTGHYRRLYGTVSV